MAKLFLVVTTKKLQERLVVYLTQYSLARIFIAEAGKMRPELRRAATILSSSQRLSTSAVISSSSSVRCFHCATRTWAIAHPITAHGPPPKAPTPAAEFKNDPRRSGLSQQKAPQQQQESQTDSAARVSQAKTTPLKKRFWKDVNVKESPGRMKRNLSERNLFELVANWMIDSRWLSNIARHPTRPQPYQSHPHSPQQQTTSRRSHRLRMGSPHIRPASAQTSSHTAYIAHHPRNRYRTRR